ncbi:Hint domain-containing protein [Phycobacter azelaicus]|uniref:Hint domain-containing protein n=1 Tax=Phycobacter azelaicus TaxID=2668075 RepID=UPI001D0249AF|nr:Hint domain-containing protein [Phycobacter azelaicus]
MKTQANPPAQQILARIMQSRRERTNSAEAQTSVALIKGTLVQTREGEKAVETLKTGDHVITRTQGFSPLSGVRRSRAMMHAVRFTAGSLGHTRPDSDLLLPLSQKVLIRDWRAKAMYGQPQAAVPAFELIDGEFICDMGLQMLDLCTLSFDRPHVIYADGMEIATSQAAGKDLRPAA